MPAWPPPASADRFLKLLVAQMQNQDPLNPMDNAQVTSQMAQINTVSGIEKLNTTVQGLSSQFMQMQALQGATLVGRDVIVPGNKLDIDPERRRPGRFRARPAPADRVKVEVLSASGQVLDTLEPRRAERGMHSFDWPAGTATNDSGLRFRVTASRAAPPARRHRADARPRRRGQHQRQRASTSNCPNAGTVAYSDVKAFN